MGIRFGFNEGKAIEALAFIARHSPGLTPLYVAKVLFYAEKWHLNRYGRPIIADTYIAMPMGPVPSTIKNFIDGKWDWVAKPEAIDEAISIDRSGRYARLMPGLRDADLTVLSESDVECISEAIAFCEGKQSRELSDLTHLEKAWREAPPNGPMDYESFIDDDNPHREQVIEIARETAACGLI